MIDILLYYSIMITAMSGGFIWWSIRHIKKLDQEITDLKIKNNLLKYDNDTKTQELNIANKINIELEKQVLYIKHNPQWFKKRPSLITSLTNIYS